MKFCIDCGKTLSILNNQDTDFCRACLSAKQPSKTSNQKENPEQIDLSEFTITCRDGKIILESVEGWLLWSGNADENHLLQDIVDRGKTILTIRKRRRP